MKWKFILRRLTPSRTPSTAHGNRRVSFWREATSPRAVAFPYQSQYGGLHARRILRAADCVSDALPAPSLTLAHARQLRILRTASQPPFSSRAGAWSYTGWLRMGRPNSAAHSRSAQLGHAAYFRQLDPASSADSCPRNSANAAATNCVMSELAAWTPPAVDLKDPTPVVRLPL
jgi:hypothetical protein